MILALVVAVRKTAGLDRDRLFIVFGKTQWDVSGKNYKSAVKTQFFSDIISCCHLLHAVGKKALDRGNRSPQLKRRVSCGTYLAD